VIVRWHELDGTDRIAVDWRDGRERHRTWYAVKCCLVHVKGPPLSLEDDATLRADVADYEAQLVGQHYTQPRYYAGILAAPESPHTTAKSKPT